METLKTDTMNISVKQLALYLGREAMVSLPKQTTERKVVISEELLYDNFLQVRDYERSMKIVPILTPIDDISQEHLNILSAEYLGNTSQHETWESIQSAIYEMLGWAGITDAVQQCRTWGYDMDGLIEDSLATTK